MELDFSDAVINSEHELVVYAKRKNREIRSFKKSHPDNPLQPEIDIEYLRRLYRERKHYEERLRMKQFFVEYGCWDCTEKERVDRCFKKQKCKYAEVQDDNRIKKARCPRDETGTCPYGNEVGTCFGFCYREILKGLNEGRRNQGGKEQEVQRDE